jgi:hypothetical protein
MGMAPWQPCVAREWTFLGMDFLAAHSSLVHACKAQVPLRPRPGVCRVLRRPQHERATPTTSGYNVDLVNSRALVAALHTQNAKGSCFIGCIMELLAEKHEAELDVDADWA